MEYEEIVKEILDSYSKKKDKTWSCDYKCEDQWISIEKGNRGYELTRDDSPNEESDVPCFILILESPHKDEFKTDSGIPQPANGSAGTNIKTHFMNSMATRIADKTRCYIYLINAIQYQCSLGLTLSTTKDGKMQPNATNQETKKDVFNAIWGKGGEEKFQERLQKALNIFHKSFDSPLYVINSCTTSFKDIVQEAVKKTALETGFNIEFFKTPHPSSYWFTENKAQKI
ncbi:MAG: hypothetical protein EOM12_08785 [Verrucomicrobiae bacterium]|nr:hypothetical protein [Verrucomicrobiae bacterium]